MCTIHANSAREAVTKMCTLPLLAGENVGSRFVVPTVAGSIDLVVHAALEHDGVRRVREIVAVPGRVEGDVVETADIFTQREGVLRRADGFPPHADRFRRAGFDVAALLAHGVMPMTGVVVGLAARVRAVLRLVVLPGCPTPRPARPSPGLADGPRCATSSSRPATRPWVPAACVVACLAGVRPGRPARVMRDDAGGARRRSASRRWRATAPVALVRMRARRRRASLRDLWPDAVDNLTSGVRAGLALPEALSQLAVRGPEELRPAFRAFAEDYRATGGSTTASTGSRTRLGDPVGDRLVESLRIAREVGGSDLGRLLRTLSAFLREDAAPGPSSRRGRAGPSTRPGSPSPRRGSCWRCCAPARSRSRPTRPPPARWSWWSGAVVSVAAYRIMLRIGRLPEDERVLR